MHIVEKKITLISIFKIATAGLLFAVMAGMFQPALAVAQEPLESFSVKLASPAYEGIISQVGQEITHKFTFTASPIFSNIYEFKSRYDIQSLRNFFGNKVEYVEQVQEIKTENVSLNDPGFTSWIDTDKQWGLVKAGFTTAWDKTTGSTKNIVAVIDTGIDATHEDLRNIIYAPGFNFLTRQSITGLVNSDDNGHGTLIAGVLGATPNNGLGIVGTNWQISLMPLKVLDAKGKGDSTTVAEAIVWAADHGARIINMSLSGIGQGHDASLANAVTYAYGKNVLIFAAAGNDAVTTGGNLDQNPTYPICYDNNENMIVGVAATDFKDMKASFSDFGRACVDVAAPGKRILSTINSDPSTNAPVSNAYAYASGTSLAVPFVSGEAALLWSLYPQATNAQIRDRIIMATDNIDAVNSTQCAGGPCTGLIGSGRINVQKAIDAGNLTPAVKEGDLVLIEGTTKVYHISGGQKRPVSTFVYNQKFQNIPLRTLPEVSLIDIPEGPAEAPQDGTLIEQGGDPAVYMMKAGMKLPVTYQVFLQRSLNFANVVIVDAQQFNSWVTGNFLPPIDGTLLRTAKNQTVYWVVDGTLHPVNFAFYIDKGLNIFPVVFVADSDIAHFPKGEAYIR